MTLAVAGAVGTRAQDAEAVARKVLADARQALGGENRHTALKALSLRADYRRESGVPAGGGAMTVVMMGGPGGGSGPAPQMAGELEIDVAFPDKYYRQDTGTGALAMTRIEGFEGDRPFIDVLANSPGMRVNVDRGTNDPARRQAALLRSQAELARLLLGMIAGTQPGFEAAYTYSGIAESPDGAAHMIDVSGQGDFRARLFIDTQTHQPLMLTYLEPELRAIRMAAGSPRGGATVVTPHGGSATPSSGQSGASRELTPEQRAELDRQLHGAESAPPKLVEQRLYFAEYREVDGILLPHRITRGTAAKPNEEWEVKSYQVNPTIKADRFKVGIE
ncbi:MAG TPA: hypothetical protein VD833_15365 [Vicinamibacterales bacterium]|nr:hypothetical protein [Vicinamibacterales bacterium]